MYIVHHLRYPLFLFQILKKFELFGKIFEKYSNIEFHENSSSESRVVPCGRTEREREREREREANRRKLKVY